MCFGKVLMSCTSAVAPLFGNFCCQSVSASRQTVQYCTLTMTRGAHTNPPGLPLTWQIGRHCPLMLMHAGPDQVPTMRLQTHCTMIGIVPDQVPTVCL